MNVIETIERHNYVATVPQIEALAVQIVAGVQANGTYLKALVATCQVEMKGKRLNPLNVIDTVHDRFYGAVLRVVAPDGADPDERARRATFARTSASTLRRYVKAGGNLKLLIPKDVSKFSLRMMSTLPEPTDKSERIFRRARDAIIRRFKRDAKKDITHARDELVTVIEALQNVLDEVVDVHVVSTNGLTKARRPVMQAQA
jgi:hypothetical protein